MSPPGCIALGCFLALLSPKTRSFSAFHQRLHCPSFHLRFHNCLCLPPTHILTPARRASTSISYQDVMQKVTATFWGQTLTPLEVPVVPDPASHTQTFCLSAPAGPPAPASPPLAPPLSPCGSSTLPLRGHLNLHLSLSHAKPFCPSHFSPSILTAPKFNTPVFLPCPSALWPPSSWPLAPVSSQWAGDQLSDSLS